ncbi:hypothetical protein P3X46_016044 [Hevea brasiliensis]|uniref:HSF-type DNA-binding domain-containing protein n=1 Tax=Hevea brasiliensis TaxID=3981 RepID=A0ABQ9LXU8_HEVBR|nr:heat stress transcription factor A-4a [Hevea brasiliensis]KAJ9172846.1 hypothetical protein P3X46_016044 [Hevea brasiliensis]
MDSSQGSSSNAPAPFLIKTYEMIDDPLTNSVVSWSQSGCSFVVWNPPEFAQDLLPKYFKHNNFSSFVRQLNTYGFRKIDPDQWEFANEEFIRGQRHLLSNIRRRKPIHSHSMQNQVNNSPMTETEKREYEEKINRLKHEKSLLQLELQRHESEKQAFGCQIMSLGERLQGLERRQIQLVSFLAQIAKKPGFASIFMQQSEYHSKKRRLIEHDPFNVDHDMEEKESLHFLKDSKSNVEKLDSSIKCIEDFFYGAGEAFTQDMQDFALASQPSPIIFREPNASSIDGETYSPRSYQSSLHSMDLPSSPELPICIDHINSPKTPPQSPQFDVNCKPTGSAPVVEAVKESESELETTNSSTPTGGANDHFWEYFLTEAPGSTSTQELDPGFHRRTSDERRWWNANTINDLTKHMEHLAPTERT